MPENTFAPNTFSVGAQPGLPPGGANPAPQPGMVQGPLVLTPQYDDARLLDMFNVMKRESTEYRWIWEREWLRDLFYVANRQWITFHPTRREWVDKRLQKWVPRPVTNKMAEVLQSIRTNFGAVNLGITARPTGNDSQSIATADLATQLAPLLHAEHCMDQVMRENDFWMITTGNACVQLSWDKDTRFNKVFLPHEQCAVCKGIFPPRPILEAGNRCPTCGNSIFLPASGPDGMPVGENISFGRGKTTALSPFEYAFPPNITRFDELPYIIRLRWRDKHWFEANLPEYVGRITWEKSPQDRSLQIFKSLALTNDVGTGSQFAYLGAAGSHTVEGVTEYELWMRPTPEFPKGLVMRVVGDTSPTILNIKDEGVPGPIPYTDINNEVLFPFAHAQYEHMGGRLYGRSALSPLIQKQDQLNQLDSLIQLSVQRMANPVWIIPENAGVENLTGEPGLIVKWNVLASNGQGKPERIAGQDIPQSLFAYRAQILKDIEDLSGAYDIIKGQRPTGVEAFSALQLLVERSQSRFTSAFQSRGELYRRWFGLAIEMERQFGPQERTWAITEPNRGYSFKHFENAQLQGQISVVVEDGSAMPKTSLGERAAIEQANQLGLVDPKDPEQRYQLLSKYGLSKLVPTLDVHIQSALQVQDDFEKWVENPIGESPLRFKSWFDPQIHYTERIKWLNSDKMKEILARHPEIEPIIEQHIDSLRKGMAPPPEVAPQQMPKVAFTFKGDDLIDPEVRAALGQANPTGPGAPLMAPGPMGKVPQGAALALANSNQNSTATSIVPGGNEQAGPNMGPV